MPEQFELVARVRARSGTNLVRRLRREGDVPAILYGGKEENIRIAVNHNTLFHSLEKEEFYSSIIVINTDGKKEQAILRDVQRHPHRNSILHADFQRVDEKRMLVMTMPIHFINEEECVGVKIGGGVLAHLLNDVEITCLPKYLPENIELDVSNLELNASLHLSDIKLPDGVNITALQHDDEGEHDLAVVSVSPPRVEIEEEGVISGETATEEAAEPSSE